MLHPIVPLLALITILTGVDGSLLTLLAVVLPHGSIPALYRLLGSMCAVSSLLVS